MKRAVLKRLTSLVACLLVVAIVSPNFVYSVKASAHEGNAGVEIEAPESKETESEKAKETKADSDKKTAKETKTVKETKADSEETKAKETEAKAEETKAAETKATEAKVADKSEETKTSEPEQTKESEKAEPSETEKPAETSAESKETVPSETTEETKSSESAEPSESSETKEETQPSESVPAESSETSESSEETEPSETSESTAAETTAPAASIKVAETAEEFIKAIASLPDQYRLIIDTDKDLSSLKGAKGVFYDGSYVLVFDGIDNYDAALKYLNSKKISFSIDGSVELCGVTVKCNNVTVNPNAKTKIAIIDTGSSLANEKVSVMGDEGEDKNGHGTSMASAVLAQSDDAYIISIKAIGDDGTGKVADVYAALQYAIDADCKVVLMAISLRDLGQYEAFKTLVADAVSKGIKVVASAGNNGTDASKYIPAGLKGVLTAGAMDENGVKLSKSNYGKCVDYYVVAGSTSEAAAILAGKVIAGKTDDLATTCKMSASEGKDDKIKRFKINDISDDFSLSNSAEDLYKAANSFCIFAGTFIHSNHMEGSVAADKLVRNVNDVMDLSHGLIHDNAKQGNFYFFFNDVDIDSATRPNVSRESLLKKELLHQYASDPAPLYLGSDLVYVKPVQTPDGKSQITIGSQVIQLDADYSNNGSGYVLYSTKSNKIQAVSDHETTFTAGGQVKMTSNKIDFNAVLDKIGDWADKFYDKHDLKVSDGTLKGMTYEIQLHDGVNYINITEEQLNNYGFNFLPSSGKCSVVINVIDSNGDHIVNMHHSEADKRVSFNGIGAPSKTEETLGAATHIMFNFHSSIKTVNLGESTTAELGTILATGAKVTIKSTHDGNAICRTFENDGVEIHQSGFPFTGKNASSTGKVTIKKIFEHPGDQDISATFTIYEGNYRSVDELKGATGTEMTRSGNTYTASMKVAGPYTIRETKTPANYVGLGDTLIHISLKSDGSVELDSPKSASNITVDSSSTDKNLTLDVTNSRKKASTAGSVKLTKKFTGFFLMEFRSATFKIYSGKFTDINKLDDSALVGEKTFTQDGDVTFTGLDEVGPYTIVETSVSANVEKVDLIYLNVAEDGKVTFGTVPNGVTVKTNDSTAAAIEVNNTKKGPVSVTVSFSKKEMAGDGSELAGAKMELTAGMGTIVNWNTAYVSGPVITGAGQKATWISGSEQLKIKLPAGTYTLKETTAPDGYDIITTTTFTVDASGKITKTTSNTDVTIEGNVVTAFDAAKKTYEVSISKKDITKTGSELAGASMKLTATGDTSVNWNKARKSGPAITANGKAIIWTSGTAPLVLNLPDGTYQLEETATLKIGGKEYTRFTTATFSMTNGIVTETTVKDDSTVTFTGTDNRTVTAFDTPVTKTADVNFSKKDFADKSVANANELTGAEMKLTATEGDATTWTADDWAAAKKEGPAVTMVSGEKAVTWTSTSTQLKISLPDGKYTLTENAAPAGYGKITSFSFEIKDGKVTSTATSETVTLDNTTNTVTAFDKLNLTETTFSKKDFANKTDANAEELVGAKMQLTAKSGKATTWTASDWTSAKKAGPAVSKVNGKSAVEWTSTSTQLKINLPDGDYELEETAAPNGYTVITKLSFKVENGKVTATGTASETTAVDSNNNLVTAFDKAVPTGNVVFSKKDFADKETSSATELTGASMRLTAVFGPATNWTATDWTNAKKDGPSVSKVNGQSAIDWTSSDVALMINLPDGKYTLSENAAPAGYGIITEFSFEIKDGKVTTSSTSETVTIDNSTNTVTAFDKLNAGEIAFSKKDMADELVPDAKELAGAKMTLTAKSGVATTWTSEKWNAARKSGPAITFDGTKITWTSGGSDLKINLPDGKYTLDEDTAPIGYNKITTFNFEVENGNIRSYVSPNVTADGKNNSITAFDSLNTKTVTFSKKDFADKNKDNAEELAGAKMKLTAVSGPATSWDSNRWKSAKTQGPAVSKVDGESAASWISGSVQLKLSLPDGTYKLSETAAPNDYTVITDITFTIENGKVTGSSTEVVTLDGTNNVVTAFDKAKAAPTPATVYISKKDMANKGKVGAEELTGAKMKLTAVSGDATTWDADDWNDAQADGPDVSKVSGESAVEWTSGTKQLKINLPDGTYKLSENGAPAGYDVITEMTFEIKDGKVVTKTTETVTADGDTNTVTAFDELKKVADIVFSKKDFADKGKDNAKELTGAKMKLTAVSGDATNWNAQDWTNAKKEGPAVSKVDGAKAVTWTSSSTQLKISLPDGTYKLEENGAPAGYDEITAITFTIENGKVKGTSTETVTLDGTNNVVTAFDKATTTCKTAISKKDMADKGKDNAEELAGASMKLTATEGKAASWTEDQWKAARVSGPAITVSGAAITWTSGNAQLMINLPDGKYTLSETTPPSKYTAITAMTFEIKDGKVVAATSETVTADASTNTVTAFDKAESTPTPAPADVVFSKKDFADKGKDNANELTGAKLKLTAVSGDAASWTAEDWTKAKKEGPAVSKVTGENAVTWTSSSTQLKVSLPDGTYKLEENGAPAGYDEITAITFTVENGKITGSSTETVTLDGTNNVVTAFDKATKTYKTAISKKDMADKGKDNAEELAGASMKLTATEGKAASWTEDQWKAARVSGPAISVSGAAITWTSGNAQLMINLPDGKYTLSETTPPSTHTAITDMAFEIKDGKVTGTSSETVTLDGTNNVVTAFDKAKEGPTPTPADIVFSKKDFADKGIENANELTGATLKLTAVSGDATTWDSDDWTVAKKDGPAVTKVTGENAVTWTSASTQLKISLPDGTYKLEENGAPAGYDEITAITFTIENGKVTGTSTETVTLDGTKNVVTAFDKLRITDTAFSKQDMADKGKDNAKELSGATMKLTAKSGAATNWNGDDWDDAKKHGPIIKMVSGEKAITWTSGSEQLLIGLPDGEYELEETAAPDNYTVITTLTFKVEGGKVSAVGKTDETTSIDGTKNVITAFDKAKAVTGDVSISKKDMADKGKTNADELSGASMQLKAVSGDATNWNAEDWTKARKDGPDVSKVSGENAITWTSGTTALKISLPDGKYELTENLAPAGYKVITTTTFELKDGKVVTSKSDTVEADGNTNTVTAFDELRITDLAFSKKDFTDKGKDNADELTGAKMKLTAVSGPAAKWTNAEWAAAQKAGPVFSKDANEAAIEWISATTQFKIGLPDGEYKLSETQSPDDKYDLITTLTFKIEDGVVTGTTDETTAIDDTNKVITGFDKELTPPTPDTSKVTFSKQDMTQKGSELENAKMKISTTDDKIDFSQLTHSGGKNVEVSGDKKSISWETTDTQFAVWLPDGKYTLEETVAPDGYNVITTTTFTVTGGKVTSTESTTQVDIDGVNNIITAFDEAKTFEVELSKEDIAHNLLANAKLSVTSVDGYDLTKVIVTQGDTTITPTFSNGNATMSFSSSGNAYTKLTGLRVGKYILSETTAPDKYMVADSITFEITNDGKLKYNDKVYVIGSPIVMIDRADPKYFTDVTINGKDKEDKSELPDIVITISSKTPTVDLENIKPTGGDVIEQGEKTITIRTKGGPIELGLPDGEYTVKQISGPKGYDKVPSAPFKVDGGKVIPTGTPENIDITDHNITVLLPKSNPSGKKSKGGSVPATGVGVSYTNVAGAALISAAVAAMGICIVVFKKKKQDEI